MQKQEKTTLIKNINNFKGIYENLLFIYSKKIMIFSTMFIFTSIGYFIYLNKKKNTINEFQRTYVSF